jgi:catechol 2,3-dioxygenase-like lactoylglutathione lyase family enzyme
MTAIEAVHVETPDRAAAEAFYANAFGLDRLVHPHESEAPSSGFRGYTLSLIVAQPASVDAFLDAALQAGATPLKPAKKQFWGGYSGVLRAPDGAIWKIATDAKKNSGPASRQIDGVVLLLGVVDMRASKSFYLERGLTVAKSFGSKYIEFDAASDAVKLGLYKRRALAKDANVPPEGSGSHRIAIVNDAGSFIDPDGFVWQRTSA